MAQQSYPATALSKVRTAPERGHYDAETIHSILDDNYLCHVAFADNEGNARCIPTLYAREGEYLYLHGAAANFMLGQLGSGSPLCLVVTEINAFVIAKSIFNHSMNYRSVVIYGECEKIEEESEKYKSMKLFSNQILPGRWDDCREPNQEEIKATRMLKVKITEASAKIRRGPPGEKYHSDRDLNYWTGLIPITKIFGTPIPDDASKGAFPSYFREKFGLNDENENFVNAVLLFGMGCATGVVTYRIFQKIVHL